MQQQRWGDYLFLEEVAEGGLGKLYLTEHRFLKKNYLLRPLPASCVSTRASLEEEVGLLALLDHPHLGKIHTLSCEGENYFFVTEVKELVRSSRGLTGTEEEMRPFVLQLAEVLDLLHREGVVHGALGFDTLLVTQRREPLLLEAGLSNVLDRKALLQASMGRSAFAEQLAFLAPEKRGDLALKERSVDVYAFGVLVYALLMQALPEGLFPMPSTRGWSAVWDKLIHNTLVVNKLQRTEWLKPLLEEPVRLDAPVLASLLEEKMAQPVFVEVRAEEGGGGLHQVPAIPPRSSSYEQALQAMVEREPVVVKYCPQEREKMQVEPLLTEMVAIPGGEFWRGSQEGGRDEMPRHQVALSPFWMDIHPVTNEQFVRFLTFMGGEKDAHYRDLIRLRDARIKRVAGRLSIESGYHKHPVVGVTWYGAVAYATWVGKRLPTEAEWEIAALGGREGPYPSGENIEKFQANFFSSDTTLVMSYTPNGYGLYDMAGNVYEWCQDWYGYNYYETSIQEPVSPKGPPQGVYRVLRGGCWKSLKEDLRAAHRHRNNPGALNGTYGFRCAQG